MTRIEIIRKLVTDGWIPLRQLGILLQVPPRSIYGRQRTRNPIETVRVGGVDRVYLEVALVEVVKSKHLEQHEKAALLKLLREDNSNAESIRLT